MPSTSNANGIDGTAIATLALTFVTALLAVGTYWLGRQAKAQVVETRVARKEDLAERRRGLPDLGPR
jgi:hypothetical protein